jgi:hypothetical protein
MFQYKSNLISYLIFTNWRHRRSVHVNPRGKKILCVQSTDNLSGAVRSKKHAPPFSSARQAYVLAHDSSFPIFQGLIGACNLAVITNLPISPSCPAARLHRRCKIHEEKPPASWHTPLCAEEWPNMLDRSDNSWSQVHMRLFFKSNSQAAMLITTTSPADDSIACKLGKTSASYTCSGDRFSTGHTYAVIWPMLICRSLDTTAKQ